MGYTGKLSLSGIASHAMLAAGFLIIVAVVPGSARAQTSASEVLAEADRIADQGNWYRARQLYADAEKQFHLAGDRRSEIYARFGRLHGDAEAGLYKTTRDAVVRELSDPVVEGDPLLKIRGLALIGTIDLNTNTAAALDDWTKVLEIAKAAGDKKWQNRANGQLGLVAGLNGDIGAAGVALYQAISQAEQLGDVAAQVHFCTWLVNGMAINGMADRAVQVVDRVTDAIRKRGYDEPPLELSIAKIRALLLLPDPQRQSRLAETKAFLAKTLAEAEEHRIFGAETELLIQSGEISLADRNHSDAEQAFRKAADVAKAADLPRMEAEALLQLSRTYRATKQPGEADTAIDKGIALMRTVEGGYRLPVLVAEKAEVQAALGHVNNAVALYQQATDLIEGLLVTAQSSRVKISMIEAMSDIYVGHFRLVWNRLHDAPEAFRIIESARGRALLDSIRYARQSSGVFQETPAEKEIARLQKSLLENRLSAPQRRRMIYQLDDAYFRLSPVEYIRSRREMEMLHRPPVTLASLRSQVSSGESLIEFVLDSQQSYALQVTQDGLKVHPLPARAAIDRAVRQFLAAVKRKEQGTRAAQDLYRMLLEGSVTGQTSSLIIVPDGSLHLVPFAALAKEDGAALSEHLTISTAPSASTYHALRTSQRRGIASRPFLGVAYTQSRPSPTQVASNVRGVFDLRGSDLKPIEYGREEVTVAGNALGKGGVILYGPNASEAYLKSQPLREFKVIHVAAHAVGNEPEPDRAALILFPGNNAEDGLWQAREIRQLRLNADLVVLSACDTGTGRMAGEEGIMNLARSFLTAGARSVVASLWSVDDRSTATLMESFYGYLAKGVQVREALRLAQADFIKSFGEKARPYYWAGFEVIGDGTRRITSETQKSNLRSARTDLR